MQRSTDLNLQRNVALSKPIPAEKDPKRQTVFLLRKAAASAKFHLYPAEKWPFSLILLEYSQRLSVV